MKGLLTGLAVVLCLARCASLHAVPSVPLATLLATPEHYDGKTISVTAYVMEGGPHGTFLGDDPNHPKFVIQLRVDRPRNTLAELQQLTRMMVEDELRDEALGVKADFIGVFEALPDHTLVLILKSFRNPEWAS